MSGRKKFIIALACLFAFIIIVIAVTVCIGYFFVRKNVDFEFDNEDIIYLCRTAINGAHNFHDSNYSTFHRIKNFRSI